MILARYLLKQFFAPFLFGLALFSGVLLMDKVFDLIDLMINKGVSPVIFVKMFVLFLPTIFSLTVPMSVLLACLLTFGRLSEDNEITALRASGLSFRQILWPPLAVAGVLSVLLIPFNTTVAPRSISGFRNLYHTIATSDPLIKILPKRFISLKNLRLYAHEVDPERDYLRGVWLYQFAADYWQRIFANEGTAIVDRNRLYLELKQGQLERYSPANPKDLLHIRFQKYVLSMPFAGPDEGRGRSWREMSVGQLKSEIVNRRRDKVSTGTIEAELHLRFAIAFSPFMLALLGVPLGMTLERGGRGIGFGAAIGVIFLYYLLLITGLNLAEKDALPALPALWMANSITGVIGIILYRRRLHS